MKYFKKATPSVMVVSLTALILSFQLGCRHQPQEKIDGYGSAEEWSSLSSTEKSIYVEGYTSGYGSGVLAVCDHADKYYEDKIPGIGEDGIPNSPLRQCRKAADSYTRMGESGKERADYSMYTNPITELYAKYPKYRTVPFAWLMILLSDNKYTSADQVFEKLEKHDMQWTY